MEQAVAAPGAAGAGRYGIVEDGADRARGEQMANELADRDLPLG